MVKGVHQSVVLVSILNMKRGGALLKKRRQSRWRCVIVSIVNLRIKGMGGYNGISMG